MVSGFVDGARRKHISTANCSKCTSYCPFRPQINSFCEYVRFQSGLVLLMVMKGDFFKINGPFVT